MTHLLAIANSTTGTKGPAPTIRQQLLQPIAHEECRGIYLVLNLIHALAVDDPLFKHGPSPNQAPWDRVRNYIRILLTVKPLKFDFDPNQQ